MAAIRLTKTQRAELNKILNEYDRARGELSEYLDTLATEWEDEWQRRTEKWQEGDAGTTSQDKINAVREAYDELPGELSLDLDSLA